MSIFKVKHLWSNAKLQSEDHEEGIQNIGSIKVDKFNSHNDSDCIIIAEGCQLKIYKPNFEFKDSHVLLESQLNDVVLQIDTGKFVFDSADRQILVLHPQSYGIYFLEKKDGHVDAGDQHYLKTVIKHSFTRKACSAIVGTFGNTKSRDLICIQALDGTISFFDQDAFLFMCIFEDIILPGPISYVSSSDQFVISKSTWVLEVYSYQQLTEFSELSGRQHKKHVPQWTYSPGEEISSIQVIRTSSNFSSIIALGERYLYCFQDNGLMKYMIRFDFLPVCFHAYLIGWYYEPNSRLLVMVVSEDSKLYIYEESNLLWSCDLLQKTISISRCFLKNLPGGVVTLSVNGIININYLATEPHLNSTIVQMNAPAESEDIQKELQVAEDALEQILENDGFQTVVEDIVNIKIDLGKPVKIYGNGTDKKIILHCPIIVTLTCEDPTQIQNIQITFSCIYPFYVSDSIVCLDEVNGTEIIQTQILLSENMDISNAFVKVIFTVTDSTGKITVLMKNCLIPIDMYTYVVEGEDEYECKIYVKSSETNLENIFPDQSCQNKLTFSYKNTNKLVSIRSIADCFLVEAHDFAEMFPVLNYLLFKLEEYYLPAGVVNNETKFNPTPELIKNVVHTFLKFIEVHAKERINLKNLEGEASILHAQFTLIQKKLLIQYGALPPGNCDALEFLMEDTHKCIVMNAKQIMECKDRLTRASCELSAVGNLILCIMKYTEVDDIKIKIVEDTLSFETFHEDIQDWEEAVTQASSYILNNILKKSEKTKEKLAPVTDQDILSHVNLKRFIKQTRLILENIFLESFEEPENDKGKVKVTRIEELVEVI